MSLKFNPFTGTLDYVGLSGSERQFVVATEYEKVDRKGEKDSTTGLLKAIEDAYKKERALWIPGGKYKIGESGTGLDLTKITFPVSTRGVFEGQFGLEVICDSACIFEGNAALGTNPVVVLAPTPGAVMSNSGLIECRFVFGEVTRSAAKAGGPVIKCFGLYEGSEVRANRINNGTIGLWVVSKKEGSWTANATYNLGIILNGTTGILLESEEASGLGVGVQANHFYVAGILKASEFGLRVDTATGQNTRWNDFHINVLGQNGAAEGAANSLVANGAFNRYDVDITTGGTEETKEVVLKAPSYFRGYVSGTLTEEPVETSDAVNLRTTSSPAATLTNLQSSWVPLILTNQKKVEYAPPNCEARTELNKGVVRLRGAVKVAPVVYDKEEVGAGTSTEGEFTLEFTWAGNVYKTAKIKFNEAAAEVAKKLSEAESGAKKLPKVAGEPFVSTGGELKTKVKVEAQNELYGELKSLKANKETLNGTPQFLQLQKGRAIANGEEVMQFIGTINFKPQTHEFATLSETLSTAATIEKLPVNALGTNVPAGAKIKLVFELHNQEWECTTTALEGATEIKVKSLKPNFAFPATTTKVEEFNEPLLNWSYAKEAGATPTFVQAKVVAGPGSEAATVSFPKSVQLVTAGEVIYIDSTYSIHN